MIFKKTATLFFSIMVMSLSACYNAEPSAERATAENVTTTTSAMPAITTTNQPLTTTTTTTTTQGTTTTTAKETQAVTNVPTLTVIDVETIAPETYSLTENNYFVPPAEPFENNETAQSVTEPSVIILPIIPVD